MPSSLTAQDALAWLVRYGIIPYWDSIDNKAMFRRADVRKDSVAFISRKAEEEAWPGVVKLLGIKTEAECATVRSNVEHLLREQGKLV